MGRVQFDNNQGHITIHAGSEGVPRPSVLGRLVELIALGSCENNSLDRLPSEIESKISFNDLNSCRWVVDQYIESSLLIDESIRELNRVILNGGMKLKRQMNAFYKASLSKYSISTKPFDLVKLRACSDEIVMDVIERTRDLIRGSSDLQEGFFVEDIEYGVSVIVSYSIIECVVLENEYAHS